MRIILNKHLDYIYLACPFCDGQIPLEIDLDHNEDTVAIDGTCKKCSSYMNIRTRRFNIVFNW